MEAGPGVVRSANRRAEKLRLGGDIAPCERCGRDPIVSVLEVAGRVLRLLHADRVI